MQPIAAVSTAARQRATLSTVGHRPWPLPRSPWFMAQTWRQLLFAHWRVDPQTLARVVPPQLPLDLHEGEAWVGVTPFRVEGLRVRYTPPLPWLSRFLELNVRTYVTVGGKPGIHFLSLDASRRPAVFAARRSYRLPYFHARMAMSEAGAEYRFRSSRISRDGPEAGIACSYRPRGAPSQAAPGTVDHFLAERYCLYTLDEAGAVLRADIHHPPWPLQSATGEFTTNTMGAPFGLAPDGDPVLHFADRQDVLIWALDRA